VPDASKDEALAYFVRKYDDVMTQLLLLKQRLDTDAANKELEKTLAQIDEAIGQRQMVGNMANLREQSETLRNALIERQAEQQAQREKALAEQKSEIGRTTS